MTLMSTTTAAYASIAVAAVLAAACVSLSHRCARLARHLRRHRASPARLRRRGHNSRLSALEQYWAQVRTASAPVLVTSPKAAILAASPAALKMFGYGNEEELRAIPATELYCNAADRAQMAAILHKHGLVRSGEFHMRRRDGAELQVLANVRLISPDRETTYYESVITDITELRFAFERQRQLESQLHLARKLELVGQLAAGIAHEINTPMQFIGDNIVFLRRALLIGLANLVTKSVATLRNPPGKSRS